MAHGVIKSATIQNSQPEKVVQKKTVVTGSRRIFPAAFKIKVLDSYRHDKDCLGNQRATARKYGIHRRQIQKWLQCEQDLRNSCANSNTNSNSNTNGSINVNKSGNKSGIDLTVRIQEIPRILPQIDEQKYWNCEIYRSELSIYNGYSGDNERVSSDSTSPIASEREDCSFSECKKNATDNIFGSIRILIGSDDSNENSGILPKPVDCFLRSKSNGSSGYHTDNSRSPVKSNESSGYYTDNSRSPVKSNESSNESNNGSGSEFESRIFTKSNDYSIGSIDNRISMNGFGLSQEYPMIQSETVIRNPLIFNRIGPINNGLITHGMTPNYYRFPTSLPDYNYNILRPEVTPMISNSVQKIIDLDSSLTGKIGSESDSNSDSGTQSLSDSDDQMDSSLEAPSNDVTRRRSFPLAFKLQVLDSFHKNEENQRATARKFRINRRQVQKWLAQERELRQEVELRRGESRQRLTSVEPSPGPVDLRTFGLAYQDRPLCLVMPKNCPKPKKDYITFKPYLDNPVVKPDEQRNHNTCCCVQVPPWQLYRPDPNAFISSYSVPNF
ncbi:uncharacterized protein LOC141532182 [Cotesia typhae]|uniref:uncharacterized protein LOC141532182 n=1 Tax=Cotesia typhae TaxID=2053667 RepID=UPI003D6929CC